MFLPHLVLEAATAQPSVGTITKVRIRAGNSSAILPTFDPLESGAIISLATSPSILALEAVTSGTPGSIAFTLTGPVQGSSGVITHTENFSPYSSFGDSNGIFAGRSFQPGSYSLRVQAFSGVNGSGASVDERTISFTVATTPSPSPSPTTTSNIFSKIRVRQGGTLNIIPSLDPLVAGAVLNASTLPSSLALEAVTTRSPGSIRFQLTGPLQGASGSFTKVENVAPYSLFGDTTSAFSGGVFLPGSYQLQAQAFSATNAQGSLLDTTTISFTVTGAAPTPSPSPSPTATANILSRIRARQGGTLNIIPSLDPLATGAVLNASTLPSSLALEAVTTNSPGSIRFQLTGPLQGSSGSFTKVENAAPYSLFGDTGSGLNGGVFPPGNYLLQVQAFSATNAQGSLLDSTSISFTVTGASPTPTPSPTPGTIDPEAELLIRDLNVVEDPTRTIDICDARRQIPANLTPWSFGKLLSDMAGDSNPSDFIESWLSSFTIDTTLNGDSVRARSRMTSLILSPWRAKPRLANGKLDPRFAPFRLLAIVYRADLRSTTSNKAGEGRFVFGALGPNCEPLEFMVILEFKLQASSCQETLAWATRFHDLTAAKGTSLFNTKLQTITDLFARKNALPSNPNGSAISQVRTGEIALGTDNVWEIREFRLLGPATSRLVPLSLDTVKLTPRDSLNNTSSLATVINSRSNPTAAMIGGKSRILQAWNAPGVNATNRHFFGMKTCNGCHFHENGTLFTHVAPRVPGRVSQLSDFLTGSRMPKSDPVFSGVTHSFQELNSRADDLAVLLNTVCPAPLSTQLLRRLPSVAGSPATRRNLRGRTLSRRSLQARGERTFYCDVRQANNPVGPYRRVQRQERQSGVARARMPLLGSQPLARPRVPEELLSGRRCIPPPSKTH